MQICGLAGATCIIRLSLPLGEENDNWKFEYKWGGYGRRSDLLGNINCISADVKRFIVERLMNIADELVR